jgi:hypothetical protein
VNSDANSAAIQVAILIRMLFLLDASMTIELRWYHARMKEIFDGWRRKVGVCTLLIACVLSGLWMRSRVLHDSFYTNGNESSFQIVSVDRKLAFSLVTPRYASRPLINWETGRGHDSVIGFEYDEDGRPSAYDPTIGDSSIGLGKKQIYYRMVFLGFQISDHRDYYGTRIKACMIPYWSIVLPLTFLSAYLLLWKPRRRS